MKAVSAFIMFLSVLAFLVAVLPIVYPLRIFRGDRRHAAAKGLGTVPAYS
jgi:hypothetical protein